MSVFASHRLGKLKAHFLHCHVHTCKINCVCSFYVIFSPLLGFLTYSCIDIVWRLYMSYF